MSNYSENDSGDYVLVHKSKAKISRARKMVIGVMAIGAVAALSGAGTFASFGATTANQATFQTGTLDLSNKVNTQAACFASAAPGAIATQNGDLTTDENATDCNALFSNGDFRPGVAATAELTLTNTSTSDYNGNLSMFADPVFGACANTQNDTSGTFKSGSNSLCNGLELTIQRANSAAFGGLTCVWPTASSCTFDDDLGTISNFMAAYPDAATSLPLTSPLASGASEWLVITLKLKDHGVMSTGIGRDNIYMNRKASFGLRFLLVDAA